MTGVAADPAFGMLAAATLGYLMGAIPFGLLLARAAGKGDLRRIGSGNIGATNALRAGGRWLGASTLLLDTAKGAAAVAAGAWLAGPVGALAGGGAAFLGHLAPAWLRFRGGKGVAVMIGVVAALVPVAGAAMVVAWVAVAAVTRRSSVAGMVGATATPFAAGLAGAGVAAALFSAMAALLVWKHRANIARLVAGTEPRIGARNPDASAAARAAGGGKASDAKPE